ncbi:cobyrinic acid a,c-diamide synthase [Komagataeibacter diospyri]|uniref:cobyrinate a,c-diamide synthase n=1 Tax=Komagataeibacter diospyri TaxID=1932662 RepID=UPI00113A2878|nr:cobyrinate a,c-diamide synthase [Komagataeibacter diospyri]GCE91151.1 cobyrinic acid a,c-diamide synthase [Komagataeibacter diospyri]
MTRGLMIAAPRSGGGKTTLTLALLAALRRRGVAVRGAKTGPDYIDPAFHEALTGLSSLNLDSWAMPPELLDDVMAQACSDCEILVTEASMGLFDGLMAPQGARGAPADIAARSGLPVVLVLDISGQGQSAAATALGFATLDPTVRIAGVILNRVGSPRHAAMATQAITATGIPVLGAFGRDTQLQMPERHLGLVQAREHGGLDELAARLATQAERDLDLDAILACARAPRIDPVASTAIALPPPGQRIAVANDAAFSFLYAHVVAGWRRAGAEIRSFSPLNDEGPSEGCDACWLPGGYPELHAGRLAAAGHFRHALARFAQTRPVHGECGGFMVLGESLTDKAGVTHRMTGLLGHATSFARRRMNLGYRSATLRHDCAIGQAGTVLRGHEFHYATVTSPGHDTPLADMHDGYGEPRGTAGGQRGLVSGTFFHVLSTLPAMQAGTICATDIPVPGTAQVSEQT